MNLPSSGHKIINESIPCNTDVDLGNLVTGMVCHTRSGRSPLYKVEKFIAEQFGFSARSGPLLAWRLKISR
ncbi:MAG: hypothetical protein QNK80_02585 [Akkermansiaceae bacterium]